MPVLVVEDEPLLGRLIDRSLVEVEHAVDLVGTGEEALIKGRCTTYDAVVLDVMLPGIDGIDVRRHSRHVRVQTPILLLTARLRPLSRRPVVAVEPILEVGSFRLVPATRIVNRGGHQIELGNKEYREALMVVDSTVTRLTGLVGTLLALGRTDSAQLVLRPCRFDLAATISPVVEQYSAATTPGQIALRDEATPTFLVGDEDLLVQLLVNLLHNAIAHTPAGGRSLSVARTWASACCCG